MADVVSGAGVYRAGAIDVVGGVFEILAVAHDVGAR